MKFISEWGTTPEWRVLLQGKEFTDDGVRRVITDVVFSHENDVYYVRYIVKGKRIYKEEPRLHYLYLETTQGKWLVDMARDVKRRY